MSRIALYLRRSTDKQDKSIEDQRTFLEGYASERGWVIVRTYCDDAISGDDIEKRVDFKRMLDDAAQKSHPFDVILCYDQSRFGRFHGHHLGYYLTLLERANVTPVFAMDPAQGGSLGRFLSFLNQEQKHEFLIQASRDTIRGQVLRVNAGHSAGMPQPYGYDQQVIGPTGEIRLTYRLIRTANRAAGTPALHRILRTTGQVELLEGGGSLKLDVDKTRLVLGDPVAVQTVRDIFETYGHSGIGFKAIAKRLNQNKVPSPRGRQWQLTTVKAILENPVYVGDLVWNRRGLSKYHRITRSGGGYQVVNKNRLEINQQVPAAHPSNAVPLAKDERADWFVAKDAHPAIVTRKLFDRVQQKLEERAATCHKVGRATFSPYLLSTFVNCFKCGRILWGTRSTNGKKKSLRYYHCSSHQKNPNDPCIGKVNADQLEYSILNWVVREFDLRDLKKAVEVRVREVIAARNPVASKTEIQRVEEAIRSIDARIDALLDKVVDLPKEVLNGKLDQLSKERYKLDETLARLRDSDHSSMRMEIEIQEVMSLFSRLEEALMAFDKQEVQKLLRHLVKDVKVDIARKEVILNLAPEGVIRRKGIGGPPYGSPRCRVGSGGRI